jgi:hypothetical protein
MAGKERTRKRKRERENRGKGMHVVEASSLLLDASSTSIIKCNAIGLRNAT